VDITGKLVVKDDVSFNAHLSVVDASFQNNVDITGKLVVKDDVSFNAHLSVVDASFQNNVDISGKLVVNGDAVVSKVTFPDGTSQTTATAGDATKIENGNSSMEIATSNGACVFTPNGLTDKTTTFAADGDIITSGNVGIGDDAPDAPLQIKGDGSTSSSLRIESTNVAGAGYMYLQRNPDGDSYILNATNHPLRLGANNDASQLYLKEDGNVGIGNANPEFPLDIATSKTGLDDVERTFMNASNTTIARSSNWSGDSISIRSVASIVAGGYIGVSDVRIKKDIMDLPSTLPLIEQIKPRTYKFINPFRGNKMTYGFIAQELEEVLSCIVRKSKDKIPNVMKIADVIDGVFTLEEATDLIEGDKIAIFDEDDTELRVKITELISDKQFKVETDEELKDKYFIYGKFVDDFQSVEHNCLLPIMIKGIQELNAKNKSLEERLAALENK